VPFDVVIGIVKKKTHTKEVREISIVVDYVADAFFTMITPKALYNMLVKIAKIDIVI
jgi:hypothetical protein